ncbi:TonB-dependent receptor [Sphingomonas azotifigens]|uniref:TonB-dependent receptor n=1 Tax=Sphingomonas azotifigens TaxID=330920 RepID=UPI0009FD6155|nr:TonB-dependent receptor [Sphingomonas azotifigens]
MNDSYRLSLRLLLAVTASTLSLAPPARAAAAPDPDTRAADSDENQQLADIVVTAQKRPENLQKTPIAISVLTADAIANRHVQSLNDLGDGAIPSLKVAPFYSRNSALIVNIRGVGVLSDSNQPARDQGVGVYVDGVYLGRAQGLGTALYDVQSIEVLKGPQGTLFGRNTEGGAVNIVTKKPSGEFHLNTTAGFGNYGAYKGEAHLDLPAVANVSVKLDGLFTYRKPLVKNPLNGAYGFNYFDKRGLHAEALWKPIDGFSADYSFDISYDASTPLYLQLLAPPTAATVKTAAIATLQTSRATTANVGVPEQPSVGKTHGHRLTLDYQALDQLQLKSITSYRQLNQSQYDNGSASTTMITQVKNGVADFTGFNFSRYSLAMFDQNQFSQEFQAIGELPRVQYVAGALYYQENVTDNAQAFATNQFTNAAGSAYTILSLDYAAQRIDRASHVKTTSVGVFGQAIYTPPVAGDILHLTVGARWTKDKKKGQLFTINGAVPSVNGVKAPLDLNSSWSRVDPLVNLAVDVTEDVHVYGKWSTGYKSGGANSRSLFYAPFNPETLSMFEIGAKTEFWDHRARLNLAAYTAAYKNIQLDFSAQYQQFDAQGNLLTTLRTTTETYNAPGTGRVKGIEADFTVTPLSGLTLNASYAYNKVSIPATKNPFRQSDGTVIAFPIPIYPVYTPTNAASGSIDYEKPMNGYRILAHLDGNYDNGFYVNYNDPSFDGKTGTVLVKQPKGDKSLIFNGRIGITDIAVSDTAKVGVSLWARNLFNEQHLFYKSFTTTSGTSGFFNEPRTWGGEVNIRF